MCSSLLLLYGADPTQLANEHRPRVDLLRLRLRLRRRRRRRRRLRGRRGDRYWFLRVRQKVSVESGEVEGGKGDE